MGDDMERKTWDDYVKDRQRLGKLKAPAVRMIVGDDRDLDFQKEQALTYALDMIGHLLVRIDHLERQLEATDDDVPTGGGVDPVFDPDNRP